VLPVASKLAHLLRRYPVVLAALLVVLSLFAARFGHHGWGMWDGPI
jgi:hypothetical protein